MTETVALFMETILEDKLKVFLCVCDWLQR